MKGKTLPGATWGRFWTAIMPLRGHTSEWFASAHFLPHLKVIFSPFFQQIRIKMPLKISMYAMKNGIRVGSVVRIALPKATNSRYASSTIHPCQVTGRPHPIPYFFAGNQALFLSLVIKINPCYKRAITKKTVSKAKFIVIARLDRTPWKHWIPAFAGMTHMGSYLWPP